MELGGIAMWPLQHTRRDEERVRWKAWQFPQLFFWEMGGGEGKEQDICGSCTYIATGMYWVCKVCTCYMYVLGCRRLTLLSYLLFPLLHLLLLLRHLLLLLFLLLLLLLLLLADHLKPPRQNLFYHTNITLEELWTR